jgi:histone-lysine N-methyltransferase SETMAR
MSNTTILNYLHDSLHLQYFHLWWIPHQLIEQLRATKVQKCKEFLLLLESMSANKFCTIVIGDESWFTLEYQNSAKWSVHREEAPEMVRQQIGAKRFMFTVNSGVGGFHIVDLITSQSSFDSQYFMSNVMTPLIANICPQGRILHADQLHFHLDNCRTNLSKVTQQFITQNQILRVSHPPYSPDIAPADFWLFGHVKNFLAGRPDVR